MRNMKNSIFILLIALVFVVSGCWDQRLLKSNGLILGVGYDLDDEELILKTITFPKGTGGTLQQTAPTSESGVITTKGNTVKANDDEIDRLLPQKFDRSKSRIIIMGNKLAEEGIFPTLDSVYRDLRGPLNAFIVIVEGEAREALSLKDTYSALISEFYYELLQSAEKSGLIKNDDVQNICPVLLGKGKDVALPLMKVQDDVAKVKGMALFDGDRMTGKLNMLQSTMFLLLTNQVTKRVNMNAKVHEDKEENSKNFVNFAIRKAKRKLTINTGDKIKVNINIFLEVEVDEYAEDHLYKSKKIKELEKKIEKNLNKLAAETVINLQEANSDVIGIGDHLKAYHPADWNSETWSEQYPNITIITDFRVKIVRHGIIN